MSREKPGVYSRPGTANKSIRYYDAAGKLVRRSAQTTDEREAWRALEVSLRSVETQKKAQKRNCLIEEAFDLFMTSKTLRLKTVQRYDASMGHWLLFFNQNSIVDFGQVTKKLVGQFVDWRKRAGVTRRGLRFNLAEATIRRDIRFLTSVWSFLLDHPEWDERIGPCPITKGQIGALKESRKRYRFASFDEWQELMSATTTEQQRAILTIATETGLREGEICSLIWSQVDLIRQQIVLLPDVARTKNDKPRVVPLTRKATMVLSNTTKHSHSQFVFWHGIGGHRFIRMSNWWKAVKRRSGVTNFRFHDIRHTMASNFLNDGGDIAVLKEILGHSSVQVTERYAHMMTKRIHEEVRKQDEKGSLVAQN